MKILYIDFVSHPSHVNFNRMHIKALRECAEIDFVFKEGYKDTLDMEITSTVLTIPWYFYKIKGNGFLCRLQYLFILLYIKNRICFNSYKGVVFSYYEEISLFFARYPQKLYLINHVNLSGLSSKIKLFFFKKISKGNTQIVFNHGMMSYLQLLGINNVKVVQHGIMSVFKKKEENVCCKDGLKIDIAKYNKIIFSPSSNSSDLSFLRLLLESQTFKTYLCENNYLFIVKSQDLKSTHSNIYVIDYYISNDFYKYLFVKSNIIAICYPETFKYRVSGVFFECISNKKNVVLSDIDALTCYKYIFSSYPYFKDVETFIECLNIYKEECCIYKDNFTPSFFMPSYSEIF